MSPLECYNLLVDVREDYIAMVRELNALKRRANPVDPWNMPLVLRMKKAERDLAMAAGCKERP